MITYIMNKDNDKMCEVFDITYDKNGYPRFLVYKDGQVFQFTRMVSGFV